MSNKGRERLDDNYDNNRRDDYYDDDIEDLDKELSVELEDGDSAAYKDGDAYAERDNATAYKDGDDHADRDADSDDRYDSDEYADEDYDSDDYADEDYDSDGNADSNDDYGSADGDFTDEDYDEENSNQKNGSKKGIPTWLHVTILGIIVLVLVFSFVKLWIWNQGNAKTQGVTGESFEVEVLDQIFLLSNDKKEGHVYDDEETILFLGNDSITYDQGETGYVEQVAAKSGATCINCGFPSTTVALKNATYSDDYALDAFSFSNVVDAIYNEDYSNLMDKSKNFSDYTYEDHARKLSEVDFDKVDTIVIFYDAQDYLNLRIGMNPDNDQDRITYSGALNYGIQKLQEKYPYIRIVCCSFTMCYAYDSTGALVNGDMYDYGNGRLTTYLQFMIDVSGATGVSFIDNYYGTVDADNSSGWLLDNVHVNAACNEYMAQHFTTAVYPNAATNGASEDASDN